MMRSALCWVLLVSAFPPMMEADYMCPPEVSTDWKISSPLQAWQVLNPESATTSRHDLAGISFTDGHPKDRAYLKPTRVEVLDGGAGNRSRAIYAFSPVSPDGIWLVCAYRETPAIIFKPLAEAPSRCDVEYAEEDVSSHVIRCR